MTLDYDPYIAAKILAEQLNEAHHQDWATKINDAMRDSATSTELLMSLRFQLTSLVTSELNLSTEVLKNTNRLIAAIDQLLR